MGKITMADYNNRTQFAKNLREVESFIKWRYVAIHYFNQSPAWMVNKMIGKDDKGEPIEFTEDEKLILKGALVDMADILRRTVDLINN